MTAIPASAHISHGDVRLVAKAVNDKVVVEGALATHYPLVSVYIDADGARALAAQLVEAAGALEGHWEPDSVHDREPVRSAR